MTNQQKHPRRLWVFLLAVAATILAGCGSSTDNAGDATSSSASTTTSVVTQVVTKTAKARSAPPRKAKPQPKPAPAPAPAATSTPAPAGPIMPNVAGKNLDTATGELNSKGIQYAVNSNGKHVILKFDWGVCSTSPAAGQPVTGVVVVNLGHFTCMR
jgi:hypothetical protein